MPAKKNQRIPKLPLALKLTLVLGGIVTCVLIGLGFILLQRFAPEASGIYQSEHKQFPNDDITVTKEFVSGAQDYYVVTLSSSSMPSSEQVSQAGNIVCDSGATEGVDVQIVAQRQYFYLPLYFSNSVDGHCANKSWIRAE